MELHAEVVEVVEVPVRQVVVASAAVEEEEAADSLGGGVLEENHLRDIFRSSS